VRATNEEGAAKERVEAAMRKEVAEVAEMLRGVVREIWGLREELRGIYVLKEGNGLALVPASAGWTLVLTTVNTVMLMLVILLMMFGRR
jgi:hypothetical protein